MQPSQRSSGRRTVKRPRYAEASSEADDVEDEAEKMADEGVSEPADSAWQADEGGEDGPSKPARKRQKPEGRPQRHVCPPYPSDTSWLSTYRADQLGCASQIGRSPLRSSRVLFARLLQQAPVHMSACHMAICLKHTLRCSACRRDAASKHTPGRGTGKKARAPAVISIISDEEDQETEEHSNALQNGKSTPNKAKQRPAAGKGGHSRRNCVLSVISHTCLA